MVKKVGIFLLLLLAIGIVGIACYLRTGSRDRTASAQDSSMEVHKRKTSKVYKEEFLKDSPQYKVKVNGRKYVITDKVKTYLFLGTDQSGNEESTGEEYQGSMADVLMVMVVNMDAQTYGVIQLNRDTITTVPLMLSDGSANASARLQLCTAHWYGGNKKMSCENTVHTVSKLLGGISIDGYYAVSMDGMYVFNQLVDGVNVVLEDDLSEYDPAMIQGARLKLTDTQAEILLHRRYGLKDDRNSERMRRQRCFLAGFWETFREKSKEDKRLLAELYEGLRPYVTDNLDLNEILSLAKDLENYQYLGVQEIKGESVLGERLGDGREHWEFYMDQASLEDVMGSLYLWKGKS